MKQRPGARRLMVAMPLRPATGIDFLCGARQPESAGVVRTTMFLGIAFTEALALFGFVLAFIITG
jgi:F-type H+-transporting ATPase subunit c